jgi:hypothetical protein
LPPSPRLAIDKTLIIKGFLSFYQQEAFKMAELGKISCVSLNGAIHLLLSSVIMNAKQNFEDNITAKWYSINKRPFELPKLHFMNMLLI